MSDRVEEGQAAHDEWRRSIFQRGREVAAKAPMPFRDQPIDIVSDRELGFVIYWYGEEGILVQLTMGNSGEGLEINRVMITGSVIDSTTFRKIPIAHIRQVALARLKFLWTYPAFRELHFELFGTETGPNALWNAGRSAAPTKISRRSKRTRTAEGDELLHLVASEYSNIPMIRGSGGPHVQLAATLSKLTGREISRGTARDLVYKARAKDFLAPTQKGRFSNQLGDAFFSYKDEGKA